MFLPLLHSLCLLQGLQICMYAVYFSKSLRVSPFMLTSGILVVRVLRNWGTKTHRDSVKRGHMDHTVSEQEMCSCAALWKWMNFTTYHLKWDPGKHLDLEIHCSVFLGAKMWLTVHSGTIVPYTVIVMGLYHLTQKDSVTLLFMFLQFCLLLERCPSLCRGAKSMQEKSE